MNIKGMKKLRRKRRLLAKYRRMIDRQGKQQQRIPLAPPGWEKQENRSLWEKIKRIFRRKE